MDPSRRGPLAFSGVNVQSVHGRTFDMHAKAVLCRQQHQQQ